MNKLLAIDSSPGLSHSYSRKLVKAFSDHFIQKVNHAEVTTRDLARQPIPHLDEATIAAFYTPVGQLNDDQRKILSLSDDLIAELEVADIVVIGAPMHNFSIPSGLKAYIDHVARVGRTFHYTENGPKGLLQGKKTFVLTSRGGNYSQMPMAALDHQEPYLRTVLRFIGLDDVEFIHSQGMAMAEEHSQKAFDNALAHIAAEVEDLTLDEESNYV